MRTLDRYILKSFLMSALMWFAVLMSLRIVVDLFVNMDDFVKLDKPFWDLVRDIVTYYGYHSLVYFIELGGLIIVVSAAFTLAMMNHTNELTAMMASGVSLHRVAWPIIVCSMLLGGLVVLDEEFVMPPLADMLVRDKDNVPGSRDYPIRLMVDGGDSHSTTKDSVSAGSVWYSRQFSPTQESLQDPVILLRNAQARAVGRILGKKAWPDQMDKRNGWQLIDASLTKMTSDEAPWVNNPDTERIYTNLGPERLVRTSNDELGAPMDGKIDAAWKALQDARKRLDDVRERQRNAQADEAQVKAAAASVAAAESTVDSLCRHTLTAVSQTEEKEGLTIQASRYAPDELSSQPASRAAVNPFVVTAGPVFPGGRLLDVRFIYRNADGQELGVFRAAAAKWVPAKGGGYWELTHCDLFYATDLTAKELTLRRSRDWMDYLSTRELTDLLNLKRLSDPRPAQMTKHVRAVEPINNLIMLLLGLPFILSRERNIKASAGLCLLIVGAFYSFIYICRYIGLPPDLAAWLPVLLFGSVASVTMYSVKT